MVHVVRERDINFTFPVQAAQQNIPILIDAERKREGLDELLAFASYVVCSTGFPQASVLSSFLFLKIFPTRQNYPVWKLNSNSTCYSILLIFKFVILNLKFVFLIPWSLLIILYTL